MTKTTTTTFFLQTATDLSHLRIGDDRDTDDVVSAASPLDRFRGNGSSPSPLRLTKTGTTIVGVVADSGRAVVLAADTRATGGTVVADKNCEKIHRLATNVFCCGAGTSGDIAALVRRAEYDRRLRHATESCVGNRDRLDARDGGAAPADVPGVLRYLRRALFKARGGLGVNLVVGGWDLDRDRAVLAAVHPHGSVDDRNLPFAALGSGGLAAAAVLEEGYRPDLTLAEAEELARRAVTAGVRNDLGSGGSVDACVLSRGTGPDDVLEVRYERAVVREEECSGDGDSANTEVVVDDDDGASVGGVNGFGALPYRVASRRIIAEDEATRERRRKERIRDLLEL